MKKCMSILLAVLLLLSCVLVGTPEVSAAKKAEKKRVLAVVLDNSGTMYIGKNGGAETWCRANYAMQVLAAMMNPGDEMWIYPMNPIQIGKEGKASKDPLKITKDNVAQIREIYTPSAAGDTHIEALVDAREGLERANADEKWLILPTDGTEFYKKKKALGEEKSIELLTKEFNESVKKVNTMYLGIGSKAKSGFQVEGKYQYVERSAANSAEVLAKLTEMGNIIFGRDSVKGKRIAGNVLDIDVSMNKLIVFVQGENISDVKLGGSFDGKQTDSRQMQYSTMGAGDKNAQDKSLQGMIVTYEAASADAYISAGKYPIEFSGTATSVDVYYEPAVELKYTFTDSEGNEVDPECLYEGDYKVSFGMVDAKTKEPVTSDLLGETAPHYVGKYYINDKPHDFTADGYTGEVTVTLQKGDTFNAELDVTYLGGYTDHADGWPGGIVILPKPAGDLKIEITGGQETYSLQKLEEGTPYTLKFYYQDQLLTGDELKKVEIKPEYETSNAKLILESPDNDHVQLKLGHKGDPKETPCGECQVEIVAFYEAPGSSKAQTRGSLEYEIKADSTALEIQMEAEEDYIIISELSKGKLITAHVKLNGHDLTDTQFAALSQPVVETGGINFTVTPEAKESAFKIMLQETPGIEAGNYTVKLRTTYTDDIGMVENAEGVQGLTLSSMPLWLKWLLIIGGILLALLIIWLIAHIPAMPKKVSTPSRGSVLTIGPTTYDAGISFPGKRSGKTLTVLCKKGTMQFGVRMVVSPGDGSYISTPQKSRSMVVQPKDVSLQNGAAKITEASINGTRFAYDPQTKKFGPTQQNARPITLKNGAPVRFSGTLLDNGKNRSFSVTTKLDFKKK